MDLRRINKKQTKIYKEYVRRGEAIYEGHKKVIVGFVRLRRDMSCIFFLLCLNYFLPLMFQLQGLIAAEYGGEDGGST